jgi:hypothetical protein
VSSAAGNARNAAKIIAACMGLAACGGSSPPTEAEILNVYQTYWNSGPPAFYHGSTSLITPIAVAKADNGITQDSPAGTTYVVSVTYSYRVNAPVHYNCNPHNAMVIEWTDNAMFNLAYSANPGDTISCAATAGFRLAKEGWVFSPDGMSAGYLIKR